MGGLYDYNLSVASKNLFAAGNVANTNNTSGGILGYASSSYTYQSTFWDTDTKRQTKSSGNFANIVGTTGLTTDKMHLKNTYQDAGWDFNYTWEIDNGKNYPYLKLSIFNMGEKASSLHINANRASKYICINNWVKIKNIHKYIYFSELQLCLEKQSYLMILRICLLSIIALQ